MAACGRWRAQVPPLRRGMRHAKRDDDVVHWSVLDPERGTGQRDGGLRPLAGTGPATTTRMGFL